jgi:hypothetical protein
VLTDALHAVAHGDVDVGGQAPHDGLAVAAQPGGQGAHLLLQGGCRKCQEASADAVLQLVHHHRQCTPFASLPRHAATVLTPLYLVKEFDGLPH